MMLQTKYKTFEHVSVILNLYIISLTFQQFAPRLLY